MASGGGTFREINARESGSSLFTDTIMDLVWIKIKITGFFGLCPSSGILNTRNHNVAETGSFFFLS
jgi:hypothetical protein